MYQSLQWIDTSTIFSALYPFDEITFTCTAFLLNISLSFHELKKLGFIYRNKQLLHNAIRNYVEEKTEWATIEKLLYLVLHSWYEDT